MSERTQRMTGGVSGAEDPPISVASGVGSSVGGPSEDPAYQGTSYQAETYPVATGSGAGAVTTETPSTATGSGSITQQAEESSGYVAGVAKGQATNVASEAGHQAKQLFGQARGEVHSQASTQQQRLAGGLRSVGHELSSMRASSQQSGPASQFAGQLADLSHQAADWLEQRDPSVVLDEVRGFARRRPGTFLAIAAVTGLVAGRLTRGIASGSSADGRGSGNGHYGNGYSSQYGNGQHGNGQQYASEQNVGQFQDPGYGAGTALPERTATAPAAVDVRDLPATGTSTGTLGAEEYGSGATDEPLR